MLPLRLGVACFVIGAVVGCARRGDAATLTLAWDHSVDRVAGYLVSYGTRSGHYTTSIRVGYVTSVRVDNLADETTYYFVVQSYTSDGLVGPPSVEVTGRTPVSPPVAISCPSPVLTSFDWKPLAVMLIPTVSGGVQPITTTCSPASGSLFVVGYTPFICRATDARQETDVCRSVVAVWAPR